MDFWCNVCGKGGFKSADEAAICDKFCSQNSNRRVHSSTASRKMSMIKASCASIESSGFVCKICHKTFSLKGYLLAHELKFHQPPPLSDHLDHQRLFPDLNDSLTKDEKVNFDSCRFCGISIDRFKTLDFLRSHENVCQKRQEWMKSANIFQCDQCFMTYSRPNSLAIHKRRVHGDDPGSQGGCSRKRSKLKRQFQAEVWCDMCYKPFENQDVLDTHKVSNHSKEHELIADDHSDPDLASVKIELEERSLSIPGFESQDEDKVQQPLSAFVEYDLNCVKSEKSNS